MKLLVFGGTGQLGQELTKRASDLNFEVSFPVEREVDIIDPQQVKILIKNIKPDVVVNCAAYTAVDKQEIEKEIAFEVNEKGASNIALALKGSKTKLIHISTDYVFDGSQSKLLTEEDSTNPLSVYGKSKLAGERAVQEILPKTSLIVRISSLHGAQGDNFVHTMLKLFKDKDEVKVVDDQFMCPTWAGWVAETLLDLIRVDALGVVHASGDGVISWYDFASEIYKLSVEKNEDINKDLKLTPVAATEFQRAAERPRYSAMDCSKLTSLIGMKPITWQEGLKSHLQEIEYGKTL